MHLPPSSFVEGIRKVVRDFFGPWTRDMMGSLEFVPKILKLVFKVRCLAGKGGDANMDIHRNKVCIPPSPQGGCHVWFLVYVGTSVEAPPLGF